MIIDGMTMGHRNEYFRNLLEHQRLTLESVTKQRDEVRADLEFRRDLFKLQEQQLNDVRAERDEARETAERYRLEANAMMMQRDEARADLVYEQGGIHATAGGWAAKYAEAIEQRDRLAEALKDVEEWPFIENAIDKIIQEIEKLEEKL
jgi:uncharacterized protein (DUF3084 family)